MKCMKQIQKFWIKLKKMPKGYFLVILVIALALISFSLPSFARFEHRNPLDFDTVWDGTVATSYRKGSGTFKDPYIISDGKELAYFAQKLNETHYKNTYFKLGNNIVLNKGTFAYSKEYGLTYEEEGITYYVGLYTNELYTDPARSVKASKNVQILPSLVNFEGSFDGSSYTIYGAYVTSNTNEEVGLFTNLTGDISNLYVDNAAIYGGKITGGLASKAISSELKSIQFDGVVVQTEEQEANTENIPIEIEQITLTEDGIKDILIPTITTTSTTGKITTMTLTGNIHKSNELSKVTFGNEEIPEGDFSVNLSSLKDLSFHIEGNANDTVQFSNVEVHITSEYTVASGIVGEADNITLKNVINKSDVYGSLYASGLLGKANQTISIADAYNIGNISSPSSAGLVSLIEQNSRDVQILRSYNAGEIVGTDSAGIIGTATNNTGSILLNSVFDTSSAAYKIHTINEAPLNISNSYLVNGSTVLNGTTTGNFTATSLTNLQSETFLTSFWTYKDSATLKNSPNRVWVFESGELPILYMDDLKNPIAEIHVGTYTWNNLGYGLDTIVFNQATAFNINEISSIKPVKEIYYKISNSNEPLMQDDITGITDWVSYNPGEVIEISEEGFYVVYVKIVDTENKVSYLNTDLLVVDLSKPEAAITIKDTNYTDLRANLDTHYIGEETPFTITATDSLSGIKSTSYYMSDQILDEEALKQLEENNWIPYVDEGKITNLGTNIIYVRVIDNAGYTTYINSDYILYGGYTAENIGSGMTGNESENPHISSNSVLHSRFTYQDTFGYTENSTHELILNQLLPVETKITLVDQKKQKVYTYTIKDPNEDFGYEESCSTADCTKVATIPFTFFKEVGSAEPKYFDESQNNGAIDEDFLVIIDFSSASNVPSMTDFSFYLTLNNETSTKVRTTLSSTRKKVQIHENAAGKINFTTSEVPAIYYNSDSITNVDITSGIVYQNIDSNPILDSTFTNQKLGVQVWITNEAGETLAKEYLKNLTFAIQDQFYYPEDNGVTYIPLTGQDVLTITTRSSNNNLPLGNYTIHMRGYTSLDGKYAASLSENETTASLIVSDTPIDFDYGLQLITDESKRILNKTETNTTLSFDLLNTGALTEPNLRVSLYQKKSLTAYNQEYQLINLQDFATSTLDQAGLNSYYVARVAKTYDGTPASYNHYDVNLDLSKMSSGGYEFVFELYDGNRKIGSVSKKYIVR